MEILELLSWTPKGVTYSIIPTILLPLAFLSTGITVVATFIAGIFGVKLKAEGPKKLLEVLLKPRVLFFAAIFNIALFMGMKGFQHIKHGPVPAFIQNYKNQNISTSIKAGQAGPAVHWQQNLEEGVFAKGVILGDELFVASAEGSLFVLNIKTGEITHKIFIGKFIAPELVEFKGHIYFGEGLHHSHHMGIYKFDPKTKKIIARFPTKGHTESRVVATTLDGEDYLFFAAGGDGLYAINPNTMKKRWRYFNGHMDSYPLVIGDTLYIGTGVPQEDIGKKRPLAIKLEVKTGKELWVKELPLSSWFGPNLINDSICFPLGEIHVKTSLGGLQCFSPQAQRKANLFIDKSVIGRQKTVDNSILFNDFKGTLYLWDLLENELSWEIDNSSPLYSFSSSQKLPSGDYLFFNRTGDGVTFNIENAKVTKSIKFNHKEAIFADPLIHDEGFLVFGLNGTVKNYKF